MSSHETGLIIRRRGILSLVDDSIPHFHFDKGFLEETNVILKRHKKRTKPKTSGDEEEASSSSGTVAVATNNTIEDYIPRYSEFTLFFFADASNINSIRLRNVVANFVNDCNSQKSICSSSNNKDNGQPATTSCMECICVPNSSYQIELFFKGTGFWCLPLNHKNRSAIIQLLSVSQVPTIIVVNNSTGRCVTKYGLEAIESHHEESSSQEELVQEWRKGLSGLSMIQTVTATATSCAIT
mmetsp:Transcript_20505/g.31600  ORF Transcript_20505/g.31600 Transcript_20505/m.31600 type:complete len:240 (+) Transcript_20505:76-795(+)